MLHLMRQKQLVAAALSCASALPDHVKLCFDAQIATTAAVRSVLFLVFGFPVIFSLSYS